MADQPFGVRLSDALGQPVPTLKCYLLVFDETFGGREQVQSFLDQHRSVVKNWLSIFDRAIFLVSEVDPSVLARLIHEQYPTKGYFMVTDLAFWKDGWLPSSVWDFVNRPKAASTPDESSSFLAEIARKPIEEKK